MGSALIFSSLRISFCQQVSLSESSDLCPRLIFAFVLSFLTFWSVFRIFFERSDFWRMVFCGLSSGSFFLFILRCDIRKILWKPERSPWDLFLKAFSLSTGISFFGSSGLFSGFGTVLWKPVFEFSYLHLKYNTAWLKCQHYFSSFLNFFMRVAVNVFSHAVPLREFTNYAWLYSPGRIQ